jgi:hypothetical protein
MQLIRDQGQVLLVVLVGTPSFGSILFRDARTGGSARIFLWLRPSGLRFVRAAAWSRWKRKPSPLEGVSYRIPRLTWLGSYRNAEGLCPPGIFLY